MDKQALDIQISAMRWEAQYREKKQATTEASSWFLETLTSLDLDFEQFLNRHHIHTGQVLDIGTGTGEQAIFLAMRGLDVIATDVSATAMETAEQLALERKVNVTFVTDNILSTRLTQTFDIITDRGCFALIDFEHADLYKTAVKKVLKKGGWLLVKIESRMWKNIDSLKNDPDLKVCCCKKATYLTLTKYAAPAIFMALQKTA